jgi:hypothetical protein
MVLRDPNPSNFVTFKNQLENTSNVEALNYSDISCRISSVILIGGSKLN